MLVFSPAQCRAARSLIDMTQPQLAKASDVGLSTVVDFERQRRTVTAETAAAIRSALEAAGVIFIDQNGDGPGVRLRRTPFRHDVSHLHALWRREGESTLAMVPPGLSIKEAPDGLVCYGHGEELGRISVVDGMLTIVPPLPQGSLNPDWLTHTELHAWLVEAAGVEFIPENGDGPGVRLRKGEG